MGLQIEAVARRVGKSRQTVWSHEAGDTKPDEDTLRRYADLYGVPAHTLHYGAVATAADLELAGALAAVEGTLAALRLALERRGLLAAPRAAPDGGEAPAIPGTVSGRRTG